MAILVLPFQAGSASDTFSTPINSITYIFQVHWNFREGAWYFDIQDANRNPIVSGIKVVTGAYLARIAGVSPMKDGVIVAVDSSGKRRAAMFDDLGTRVLIKYVPVGDLIAMLNGAQI